MPGAFIEANNNKNENCDAKPVLSVPDHVKRYHRRPARGENDIDLCHLVAFAVESELTVKQKSPHDVVIHFEKRGCLCGTFTLTLAIRLLSCLEITVTLLELMQAPFLLNLMTTTHSDSVAADRTTSFSTPAVCLFVCKLISLITCLITVFLLLYASLKSRSRLILAHVAWQTVTILVNVFVCLGVILAALVGTVNWPDTVVFVTLLGISAGLETWCLSVTLAFCRQTRVNEGINERLRRPSQTALREVFANGSLKFSRRASALLQQPRRHSSVLPEFIDVSRDKPSLSLCAY